jgi:RNA polymerase sigma-70 factor, ECF subfamily
VRWSRVGAYELPEAWIRRVTFNLAVSRLARAHRMMAALARHGPPAHQPAMSVDSLALTQALARQPVRYRKALVLHHLVGLPVEQVAAELRLPAGTVRPTWPGAARPGRAVRRGRRRRRRPPDPSPATATNG